jgi:outer membrane lipoprotein-sorting protein
MSIFTSRPAVRWAVPALAAVAVVGAGVAAKTLAVAAEPNLPPRTAAQLLVDLQTARLDGLSGTVVERADLGLPNITSLMNSFGTAPGNAGGSADLKGLVDGKHTLRVWYSGPDKTRLALVGTNGESDIVRNGKDLWFWDSGANTATHRQLDTDGADAADHGTPGPSGLPSGLATTIPSTPQEAAQLALDAIDDTTVVSTGNSAKIAGRDAYELILAPRDTSSLVGQVRLAIDAKEHVPLRVQVLSKGHDQPRFEVGFTQVSFAKPDPAQFDFKPPSGAKVKDADPNADKTAPAPGKGRADGTAPGADGMKSVTIGKGWTTVFVVRLNTDAKADNSEDAKKAEGFLKGLPKTGNSPTFTSYLFTAMMTPDGRILVGPVSADRLAQVAADPAAQLK